MRKTLIAALVATAGLSGMAFAQVTEVGSYYANVATLVTPEYDYNGPDGSTEPVALTPVTATRLGVLSFSLNNVFQAYQKGSKWGVQINPPLPGTEFRPAGRTWNVLSYDEYLRECAGTLTYTSNSKKVDNKAILTSLNKALSRRIDTYRKGPFAAEWGPYSSATGFNVSAAKIVVVSTDNELKAPPYPPSRDELSRAGWSVDNSPYVGWNGRPDVQPGYPMLGDLFGDYVSMEWPAPNYIAWGKPVTLWQSGQYVVPSEWAGARVFVIDPNNANINLRCFDVTPFFSLEESYCWICWDTMDRVTDGTITAGETVSDPPCAIGGATCGRKGSGTTRLYWTVKFSNVETFGKHDFNNNLLGWYYDQFLGFSYYGLDTRFSFIYGVPLSDLYTISQDALAFSVSGYATYKWSYKTLSDGYTWPVGTYNMTSAGYGASPMCGHFTGPVTLTEYDRNNSMFKGVFCLP